MNYAIVKSKRDAFILGIPKKVECFLEKWNAITWIWMKYKKFKTRSHMVGILLATQ